MIIKVHPVQFSNLLTLFCLMILGCVKVQDNVSGKAESYESKSLLVDADSLLLSPGQGQVFYQGKAFTGTSVTYFANGNTAASTTYYDGKKQGFQEKWFENGRKSYEAHYVSNKLHGMTRTWWRNGNLRSQSNYDMGVAHGVQMQWYVSGARFKKINLVNGREEGLQQSWRENGKIYNNYEAKNGRIFGLKRAKLCYELDDEFIQTKLN